MPTHNRVVIEQGNKKVFASALDWPGWSRSGKTEADALANMAAYTDRYQRVADRVGLTGAGDTAAHPEIVEYQQGDAATEFGVPANIAQFEYAPLTRAECDRQIALLQACWAEFDDIAARVSPELRKGPRGGGRDRDAIIEHTLEAERSYARRIGVATPAGSLGSPDGIASHRAAVCTAIREITANPVDTRWPLRYFIRRAAWHVLDHAWEMEDKDLTERAT